MLLGYPISELAWLAVLIAGAGIIVGILAGLFGIGGGAIIVPTTVRSYIGHKKKGAVIPNVVRAWTLPAVIGVAIGSVAAAYAPAALFKSAFVVFAIFIATRMFFGGDRWSLGNELPQGPILKVYGFITGLFSSLVGVSGGAVSNAVLTLYGQPMQRAVATSSGIGVPITIAGTVGYVLAGLRHMQELPPLSIGFVSVVGFVLMAPVSSYTATYGVRLAHWMPRRKLEIAFGILLLFVATRFLISLF